VWLKQQYQYTTNTLHCKQPSMCLAVFEVFFKNSWELQGGQHMQFENLVNESNLLISSFMTSALYSLFTLSCSFSQIKNNYSILTCLKVYRRIIRLTLRECVCMCVCARMFMWPRGCVRLTDRCTDRQWWILEFRNILLTAVLMAEYGVGKEGGLYKFPTIRLERSTIHCRLY
jgi:hypothetical protein